MRATHTVALLEVSAAAHEEIRSKLEAAGYHHAFLADDDGLLIDMHGIALCAEKEPHMEDEKDKTDAAPETPAPTEAPAEAPATSEPAAEAPASEPKDDQ